MGRLLEGKVAVVTGAGRGIGRGHALELARHGASVLVNDLGSAVDGTGSGRDADETVRLIEDRGGVAVADYGDVGDESDTKAMVDRAIESFGRLDVVVNNAGIVRDRAVWNMAPEDFDIVVRVHLRGSWLMTHHAAVHWRSRAKAGEAPVRGRIVNTTSGAGLLGNFGQSNYATAKAAIAGLTLTTSLELYGIGVTVNAVGPGGLTRLSATIPGFAGPIEADEIGEDEYHPMDPAGSSPIVAWLASDEAQNVTGQVIRVIHDRIYLMKGWTEAAEVSSGERRWDANALGAVFATDIFGTLGGGVADVSAERQLVGGDLLHSVENGVAWIKLNRPDAANALTPDQRNAMIELLQSCDEDRSVRVVVLGATGRHFCGGADLRIDRPELDATGLTPTGTLTGAVTKTITYGVHKLIAALQDCHKPVVASVHGTAAGVGVQLALACDLVLMAEEASFIEIYVRRGIVPDGAAAYLLTRLAGLQRAKELMFLGERVSAAKAREYGLVTEVVPADVLAERTTELAGTLARGPTVAIGMMKRLANRALDADRAAAMFEEAIAQEMVTGTVDAREGIASFLEGRTAEFEGY